MVVKENSDVRKGHVIKATIMNLFCRQRLEVSEFKFHKVTISSLAITEGGGGTLCPPQDLGAPKSP